MIATIQQFKTRQVQNLAWVIGSPPLASGFLNDTNWWNKEECINEFNDCLPALITLDENPEPLLTHIAQLKSKRLGLCFESYISFWLRISPNYRQLKQNIQIIENGHTYGELDFIIEDIHTNKIIHLEVAVKFYLGRIIDNKLSDDPYQWFGTNTNDQLGRKLDHLKRHQTQLTINYQNHLDKKLGFKVDEKHCILKGRLFYPFGFNNPPKGANNNHLRGRWTQSLAPFSHESFIPIEKEYWLATLGKNELDVLASQQGLNQLKRSQCYVQTANDLIGKPKEAERLFHLTNDFWDFN